MFVVESAPWIPESSCGRLIAEQDVAIAEYLRFGQAESQLMGYTLEQCSTAAKHDRVHDNLVLIDQIRLCQLGHDAATTRTA